VKSVGAGSSSGAAKVRKATSLDAGGTRTRAGVGYLFISGSVLGRVLAEKIKSKSRTLTADILEWRLWVENGHWMLLRANTA
jgi:hypothetical protein